MTFAALAKIGNIFKSNKISIKQFTATIILLKNVKFSYFDLKITQI